MFGSLGMGELFIILVIVLVIFGAGKLPEIGGALGRGIRSFKKEMNNETNFEPPKSDKIEDPKSGEKK